MPTLADRIRDVAELSVEESEYLRSLCSSWQVLADLSFSDLLLYVRRENGDEFQIVAQLRPLTSQTLYPTDMVGTRVTQPEQPIVERAFREGRVWRQDDPVLLDGIPIQMDAVPVRRDGKVIAVVTKEGSPATSRRPGRLEQIYLEAAGSLSDMIAEGLFPFFPLPEGDWPRVGEGLLVLGEEGVIRWASPNAISSLHRLGVSANILGRDLDGLGVGETPVGGAMREQRVFDGELVRGDTFVRFRVVPLIEGGASVGAVVLVRDITEVRQKERVISVKDATIREIHHRVKNNLQTIASLLRLQGRRLSSDEAKSALAESVLRVGAIALVHEALSEAPSEMADFGDIARRISMMVSEGLVSPEKEIEIKVTGSTGPLGAEIATPLAVTVTELIQNAVEHAFPDAREGTISVELTREDENVVAVVRDDGVGMKEEPAAGSRLGLQIVRSLIAELGGSVDIASDGGMRAEVRVPVTPSGSARR
jgi:two-component sensor histidine kinase